MSVLTCSSRTAFGVVFSMNRTAEKIRLLRLSFPVVDFELAFEYHWHGASGTVEVEIDREFIHRAVASSRKTSGSKF